MTLGNIGWAGFAIGSVVIAAVLFMLQRLRVRHHEQVVMTTLFWKEAIEQTRARVLWQQFRHPWAYVLILLIASLLWFAFCEPASRSSVARHHILILDGSAGMTIGERFEKASRALQRAAARLPRDTTTVLFSGSQLSTLLAPNESLILLRERLKGVTPEAAPSRLEDRIRQISFGDDVETVVHLVGMAPLNPQFRDLLPDRVSLVRSIQETASRGKENAGITQLGVAAARSGRWNRVDGIVEIRGPHINVADKLVVNLAQKPYDGEIEQLETWSAEADEQVGIRLRLPDLPANGQLLQVRLGDSDVLTLDDVAELYLPHRPLIKVALAGDIPVAIRQVLQLDGAVTFVSDAATADVLVTTQATDASQPALVLTEDQSQHAFLFGYDGPRDATEVVQQLFHNLGLDQIDAQGLAEATGEVIQLGAERVTTRRVAVWQSLFSPEFDFTRSSAFPLFIGQSVRWLAAQPAMTDRAAAGDAVTGTRETYFLDKLRLTPGGQPFRPPRAGRYQSASGQPLAASLLDRRVTRDRIASATEPTSETKSPWRWSLVTIIGSFCLCLLLLEWHLFRRGRIP